jgi:hypothetical protein
MKFVDIRKAIQSELEALHSRVFFYAAPDNAVMPYVVFDLPNSVDSGTLENFVMDIDIWDDKNDTTALETLADKIDMELHKKAILVVDSVGIVLYRSNRLVIRDDDTRIRRRRYAYQARTYQKYY